MAQLFLPTPRLKSAPMSCGTYTPPIPIEKRGFADFGAEIQICGCEIQTRSTKIQINEFLHQ